MRVQHASARPQYGAFVQYPGGVALACAPAGVVAGEPPAALLAFCGLTRTRFFWPASMSGDMSALL